jgi:hypothetical protein
MKRHKRVYIEKVDDNLSRYVMIMRPKIFKSKINKIMFWAHSYKWDRAYYKKYEQ